MTEEQWNAIRTCDQTYDGAFFYAVKTTGIFCRPSCTSRVPKRDNVVLFAAMEDAVQAGYRACKRCQPTSVLWPAEELVQRTTDYIHAHIREPLTLHQIAEHLHINPHHLHRTFRRVVGTTPMDYVRQSRLAAATQLLEDSPWSVSAVADAVGFPNAAHFSTVFRKQFGMSPSDYRLRSLSLRAECLGAKRLGTERLKAERV